MRGPVEGPKPFIHQLHHSHSRPRDRPHSNFTDPTRCQTNLWPLCHLTPAVPDRRQKSEHQTNTPSVPKPTRFPEHPLPRPQKSTSKRVLPPRKWGPPNGTQKVGIQPRTIGFAHKSFGQPIFWASPGGPLFGTVAQGSKENFHSPPHAILSALPPAP